MVSRRPNRWPRSSRTLGTRLPPTLPVRCNLNSLFPYFPWGKKSRMIDLSCIVLGINIFLITFSFRQSKRTEMKDNNCLRYHTVPHYYLTAPLSGELVTKTILSSQYYKRRGRWFINGCKNKPSYDAEFQLWGTPFFFFSHYVKQTVRYLCLWM